jgi:hypothetical protein
LDVLGELILLRASDEGLSEAIESIAKEALGSTAMRFYRYRFQVLMDPQSNPIGPRKGDREQAHQLGDAFRIADMGSLQVKPPAFDSGKEGLNLPSFAIERQGAVGGLATEQNDGVVALCRPNGTDKEALPATQASIPQSKHLACLQMGHHTMSPNATPVSCRDIEAFADADGEAKPSILQVAEPGTANEFPIRHQSGDMRRVDVLKELFQERNARLGITTSLVGQHPPHQRDGDPISANANEQYVVIATAKAPHVRSIVSTQGPCWGNSINRKRVNEGRST